ncbi:MAG: polysaccharide deacetylase family protein [Candidatus Omnitrophota bacterium]|nr:polysaccharide deacetylase family protein [Candidatus Omnitrophota bacterium]
MMPKLVAFATRVRDFCVRRPLLKKFVKRMKFSLVTSWCRLQRSGLDPRPKILGYHAVGDGLSDISLPAEKFRAQMDWLVRNGYQILTLKAYWEIIAAGKTVMPRTVVLTFDDGYRSVLQYAAPILARYGLAGTVFIITDHVGKTNAYDKPFLGIPELPLLDWDEIRQLKEMGWDIQSHTRQHYPLHGLGPELLRQELTESKRVLEEMLGEPCEYFCYPYGAWDEAATEAVSDAGYNAAVTCLSGTAATKPDGSRHRLRRTLVDGLMSLGDFAALFTPAYHRYMDYFLGHKECAGMLSAYPAGKAPISGLEEVAV